MEQKKLMDSNKIMPAEMDDDESEILPIQVILEDLDKAKIEEFVKREMERGTPIGWITFYLGDEDWAPRFNINDLVNLKYLDPKILKIKPQIKTSQPRGKTFINPIEKSASGIPVLTGLDSITHKVKWYEEKHTKLARYEYQGRKNPENRIYHYISDPYDLKLLPFDEAVQIIDKFGINTAKLHLIFSIHASQERKPWEGLFRLQGTQLIKDLNLDKRTDLKKSELLNKIASTAWALASLVVQAEWQEGKGKKTLANIKTSRLWNVAIQVVGQKNADGKVSEPEEIYLDVTPGLWTESFLNQLGAKSRTALYHYSFVSEKIMSIRAYPSDLALRIAMRQSIMPYRKLPITVGQFLVENMDGAADKIRKAENNSQFAYELKEQWNNALKMLEKAGFKLFYDDNSYPSCLRPDSEEKTHRGYFARLMKAKINITPPELNSRRIVITQPSEKPKKLPSVQKIITGSDIRKARLKADVKATDVAKYMKKSRAWLSQKETGKRSLTDKEGRELLQAIRFLSKKLS